MTAIKLQFTIIVTPDEDGGYIARCEELDLFTCADTLDELKVMVESMLTGHLQARSRQGTLPQLIAQLQHSQELCEPVPPFELVMDMKLRQTSPFSLA